MVPTTLVPLDEYLRTSYDPDVEYADGALIGRNVGSQLHGLLQTIVAAYFHQLRKRYRIKVFTETRLRMGSTRYRIPDVMIVEQPCAPGRVVTDIPAVVFEIKSPDDTLDQIFEKCLEYMALVVPNIVVLDPENKRQYVFADHALRLVPSINLVLAKGGNMPFPADELFAELNEES